MQLFPEYSPNYYICAAAFRSSPPFILFFFLNGQKYIKRVAIFYCGHTIKLWVGPLISRRGCLGFLTMDGLLHWFLRPLEKQSGGSSEASVHGKEKVFRGAFYYLYRNLWTFAMQRQLYYFQVKNQEFNRTIFQLIELNVAYTCCDSLVITFMRLAHWQLSTEKI